MDRAMNQSLTHKEASRLEALARLRLLDTPAEPEFDELAGLAASISDVPISAITLIDERRQWFKAVVGMDSHGSDRESAFCSYTIQQDEIFVVEDATADQRFQRNPLVLGDPHIRFYAGMPISGPTGEHVGALCVFDRQPRQLTGAQRTALEVLARQVNARMELRMRRMELRMRRIEQEQMLVEQDRLNRELLAAQQRFQSFMDESPFLSFVKSVDGRMLYYNRRFAERFGITMSAWLGKTDFDLFPAEDAQAYRDNDLAVLRSGQLQVLEERSRESDGSASLWHIYKFPCGSGEGVTTLGGIAVDITETTMREEKIARMRREISELRDQVELAQVMALQQERSEMMSDRKMEMALVGL
ncbi:PAS domain S-box-containing protein [Bryocella elongata]|uniref:PAS domain S-box-containing protein n=1 Tax=Bryocella elongata TaxID=863522 RepID=A0A1H5W7R6_9BACT|nr:PAS domain-containing protein [Bryocella elongata]SEF94867.1 PAS domain S-box-containing protein [Bryocella elongata]